VEQKCIFFSKKIALGFKLAVLSIQQSVSETSSRSKTILSFKLTVDVEITLSLWERRPLHTFAKLLTYLIQFAFSSGRRLEKSLTLVAGTYGVGSMPSTRSLSHSKLSSVLGDSPDGSSSIGSAC